MYKPRFNITSPIPSLFTFYRDMISKKTGRCDILINISEENKSILEPHTKQPGLITLNVAAPATYNGVHIDGDYIEFTSTFSGHSHDLKIHFKDIIGFRYGDDIITLSVPVLDYEIKGVATYGHEAFIQPEETKPKLKVVSNNVLAFAAK